MTSFEVYLGRKMKPTEGVEEREYYIKLILSPEQLSYRETKIKRSKPKQLKLF